MKLTDDQIRAPLNCVRALLETAEVLEGCQVEVVVEDEVLHDGDHHRHQGTVTIDGVEWSLVLERYDD